MGGQARTSEKDEAEDESSSHEAPPPSRISTLPSARCTRSCPSDSLPAHPSTLSGKFVLLASASHLWGAVLHMSQLHDIYVTASLKGRCSCPGSSIALGCSGRMTTFREILSGFLICTEFMKANL